MFDEMTREKILSDMLSEAPPGIDVRQGSIYYDAVAGAATLIARTYADLNITTQLIYIDSTGGEYLDRKAAEHGLTRYAATKAVYEFTHTGTTPALGTKFYYDRLYYTLQRNASNDLCLVADEPGEASNHIDPETPAIPVDAVTGLLTSAFGSILVYGTETETDDNFRERLQQKISGPTENGNKAHYKIWCEEVDGVGKALILPLWNGPNTVKGVLITPEGTPVSDAVVAAVQQHVDPDDLGTTDIVSGVTYNVGDGLGEGAANIGAHFTAVKAGEWGINVLIQGFVLKAGYDAESTAVVDLITAAITQYLKEENLENFADSAIKIYPSKVTALVYTLPFVEAFASLSVNSVSASSPTAYAAVPEGSVAKIGSVEVEYAQS